MLFQPANTDNSLFVDDLRFSPPSRQKRDTRDYFKHFTLDDIQNNFTSGRLKDLTENGPPNITNNIQLPPDFDLNHIRDASNNAQLSPSQQNTSQAVYDRLLDIVADSSANNNGKIPLDLLDPAFTGSSAEGGLIYRIIASDPELLMDPEVRDVILKITGFEGDRTVDPLELLDVMRVRIASFP